MAELNDTLRAHTEEIAAYKRTIEALETTQAETKQRFSLLEHTHARLQDQTKEQQEASMRAQNELVHLLETERAEAKTCSEKLEQAHLELERFKQQHIASQEKCTTLQQSCHTLEAQLQSQQQDSRTQLEALRSAHEQTDKANTRLASELQVCGHL